MFLEGEPIKSLEEYRDRSGLVGLDRVLELTPEQVITELDDSGLRGRGGAGFPVGTKWRSIVAGGDSVGTRFVVANGAEGEPGTFKDRALLRHDPYSLVEGLLIAARVLAARRVFVALKASFDKEIERVSQAAADFGVAGLADDVQIELVLGPDEYLFGEEKALLEVIEGEDPLPRLFPPYIYGLFTTSPQLGWSAGSALDDGRRAGSNPTLVNNVETLSTVPRILGNGAAWYRGHGTDESPGHIVCTVSGDTTRHGVGVFEMGTPLSHVIDEVGGGLPAGRAVKYVLSGVSNPVVRADHLDVPISYESFDAIGSGLGTGGFIVYDDRTDPVELAHSVSRFLAVESCGQCPPCKLGTQRVSELLEEGADFDTSATIVELKSRLATSTDSSRCYLPTQAQRLVGSLVPDMRTPELRSAPRGLLTTKLVDLIDERFVLDERQAYKQPDWTYADDAI